MSSTSRLQHRCVVTLALLAGSLVSCAVAPEQVDLSTLGTVHGQLVSPTGDLPDDPVTVQISWYAWVRGGAGAEVWIPSATLSAAVENSRDYRIGVTAAPPAEALVPLAEKYPELGLQSDGRLALGFVTAWVANTQRGHRTLDWTPSRRPFLVGGSESMLVAWWDHPEPLDPASFPADSGTLFRLAGPLQPGLNIVRLQPFSSGYSLVPQPSGTPVDISVTWEWGPTFEYCSDTPTPTTELLPGDDLYPTGFPAYGSVECEMCGRAYIEEAGCEIAMELLCQSCSRTRVRMNPGDEWPPVGWACRPVDGSTCDDPPDAITCVSDYQFSCIGGAWQQIGKCFDSDGCCSSGCQPFSP